jgi:uncharacterized phage protein (TIGR01671 family)
MRDIKFRVWYNVHEGKMYPVQSIHTNKDGSITVNATNNPEEWNPIQISGKWQTGYLMQFTGLLDENDKEIYEGDILTHKDKDIHVVEYNCCRWSARLVKHISSRWPAQYLDCNWMHWEVIGNIYENPDLLQEEPNQKDYINREQH